MAKLYDDAQENHFYFYFFIYSFTYFFLSFAYNPEFKELKGKEGKITNKIRVVVCMILSFSLFHLSYLSTYLLISSAELRRWKREGDYRAKGDPYVHYDNEWQDFVLSKLRTEV